MKILFRRMLVLALLLALTSGIRVVPDKPQSTPVPAPLIAGIALEEAE